MAVLNYHNFDTLGFTTGVEGPNQFYSSAQTASGYENIHIRTDSSNKFNGMNSLRVEIDQSLPRSGVWRSELRTQVYGGYPNVMEGFYAVAIKLGTTAVGEESAVISQLWDGTSGPSLSLQWRYSDNSIFARIHGGPSNVNFPLFTGDSTWHTVILYHHSLPNSFGKLKIWVDGTLTVDYTGRTSYATETDSTTPYWKLGLYDSGFDDDNLVSNRVIYLSGVSYHDATDSESDTLEWIDNFWNTDPEPEPEKFTVTTDHTTGGTVSGAGEYEDGETANLVATPTDEHWVFEKWTEDGEDLSIANPLSFTVEGDRNIKAVFAKKKYALTVTSTTGGTATGGGLFEWEITTPLTASINSGYQFSGWYRGDTFLSNANPYSYTTRKQSDTVQARFVLVPVSVPTADVTTGTEPLTVQFDCDWSGTGATYLWDFQDGNTSTLKNPEHTFSAGTYEVECTVTVGELSATETITITVSEAVNIPPTV